MKVKIKFKIREWNQTSFWKIFTVLTVLSVISGTVEQVNCESGPGNTTDGLFATTTEFSRNIFNDEYYLGKMYVKLTERVTTAENVPETTTMSEEIHSTTETSLPPEISFDVPTTIFPLNDDLLPPCSDYFEIRNIVSYEVSSQEISFTWESAETSNCYPVVSIRIRKTNCPSCNWSYSLDNLKESSLVLNIESSNLTYAMDYDFIITPAGHRRGNMINFRTTNPPMNNLGPVRNLNYTIHDNHTIVFTWRPPSDEEVVELYKIFFQDIEGRIHINDTTDKEEWSVHDNEPCTSYQFTIYAQVDGTLNEEAARVVNMPSELPGVVTIDVINSTSVLEPMPSTTLEVLWLPPETAARCAKFYIIQFWRKHPLNGSHDVQNLNVTETKMSITNLDACEVYFMRIVAAIDDAQYGFPLTNEINATGRVPIPPNILQKNGGTSTTFKLYVKNADISTVCQLFIAKFVCSFQGTNNDIKKEIIKEEIINNQMSEYRTSIEGLEPFSKYECFAQIRNELGWSDEGREQHFVTDEDVPGRPKKVEVTNVRSETFTAHWDEPQKKNGRIQIYRGYVRLIDILYTVGPNCPPMNSLNKTFTEPEQTKTHTMDGLYPYSRYSIQVAAATSKGVGEYSDTTFTTTLIAPSDPVQDFDAQITDPTSITEYNGIATFQWAHPCRTNGPLERFDLFLYGTRGGYDPHIVELTDFSTNKMYYTLDAITLKPSFQYNASIHPVTEFGTNVTVHKVFRMPAGVPKASHMVDWGHFESARAPNPTKNIHVSIRRTTLVSDEGDIRFIAILLSQRYCQPEPELRSGFYHGWPETLKWSDVQATDCIQQYQTTPKMFNPRELKDPSGDFFNFVIGDEDCTMTAGNYCNGALRPGTEYAMTLRILTEMGYSDTRPMYFETGNTTDGLFATTTEFSRNIFNDEYYLGKMYVKLTERVTTAENVPETTTMSEEIHSTTETSLPPEISFDVPTTIFPLNDDLLPPCSDYFEIRNIVSYEVSSQEISFTWESAETSNCYPVVSIRIRKTNCPSCNWSYSLDNLKESSLVLNIESSNLTYAMDYDFIITPAGHRRGNMINFRTTNPPMNNLGPVRNLNYTIHDNHTIVFTWRPPSDEEVVELYKIFFQDIEGRIHINDTTDKEEWSVHDNEPCTSYQFTIYAQVDGTLNEEAARVVNMPSELPGVVTIDVINSTSVLEPMPSTTLEVLWLPPETAARCAKFYIIQFWRKHPLNGSHDVQNLNVTETKMSITNLDACEVYFMRIVAAIDDAQYGFPLTKEINATGRVPIPPNILQKNGGTSTTFKLYVKNADISTVCQLFIAKFVCSFQGTNNDIKKEIIKEEIINNQMSEYRTSIEGLEPFSKYECFAQIRNELGWSDEGREQHFVTDEDVPGRPKKVEVTNVRSETFTAHWDEPQKKNGRIQIYRGYVRLIDILYTVGPNCPPMNSLNKTFTEPEQTKTHTMDGLYPYSRYSIQVAAATSKGVGEYSDTTFTTTLIAPSDPVQDFDAQITDPTSITEYNGIATFQWAHPCRTNGPLERFDLFLYGTRGGYDPHIVELTDFSTNKMYYTLDAITLKPSFQYNASIHPVTEFGTNVTVHKVFRMPAGVPKASHMVDWGHFESARAPNPTKNIHVSIRRTTLVSDEGDIRFIAILLSQRYCQPEPELRSGFYHGWPETLKWSDVQATDCIQQYQTTPKMFNPRELKDPSGDFFNFVIGDEDCTMTAGNYCNGALRPGTEYAMTLRILTEMGYSDTRPMYFETENLINIFMIVVGVACILFITFLVGLVVLYRTGTLSRSGILVSPYLNEPSDVTPKSFVYHYNELTANKNEKLLKEYKTIESILPAGNMIHNAAKQNTSKNRYSNIMPFDFNRVILSTADDDTDYINASYLDGFKEEKEYVATQGPKENTCSDFWRMILELRAESIVMLTSFKEGNKVKCAEYFPKFNEFQYYDDVIVKCTQEMAFNNYKKRIFTVEKGTQLHQVTHYHFLKWLDHDCPKNPVDLIKFVKIVRSERKAMFVPLVVHCSAGVGRTGTFIALDIIMQKIKQEKKLNIYEIVKQLRLQRVKMVQTPGQYIYLYKCAYEVVIKEKDWKQRLKERLNGKEKELDEKPSENMFVECQKISTISTPSLNGLEEQQIGRRNQPKSYLPNP